MNKKVKNIITGVVAVFMLAVIALAWLKNQGLVQWGAPGGGEVVSMPDYAEELQETSALESMTEEEMVTYLNGGPPLNVDEATAATSGVRFTVLDAQVSKKIDEKLPSPLSRKLGAPKVGGTLDTEGLYNRSYNTADNYMMDWDSTIINDYSYLIVRARVENENYYISEQLLLGDFCCAIYRENTMLTESSHCIVSASLDSGDKDMVLLEKAVMPFEVGDVFECTVVMIVQDQYLRDMTEIYLYLDTAGVVSNARMKAMEAAREEAEKKGEVMDMAEFNSNWNWPPALQTVGLRHFIDDGQLEIPEVENIPLDPPALTAKEGPQVDEDRGYVLEVTKVEVTRDAAALLQGKDYYGMPGFANADGVLGEDGKLTGGYSFMLVDLHVTNNTEMMDQFWFSNERVYAYQGEKQLGYGDLCGFVLPNAKNMTVMTKDDGLHYRTFDLPKGKDCTATLVFVVRDELLKGTTLSLCEPLHGGSSHLLYNPNTQALCWNPLYLFFALNGFLE